MEKKEFISKNLKVIENYFNIELQNDDLEVHTSTYIYTLFNKSEECLNRTVRKNINYFINKTPLKERKNTIGDLLFRYIVISSDEQRGVNVLKRLNKNWDYNMFEIIETTLNDDKYYIICI